MSPTLTTFLFELANFLLLAGLIGWVLFRPVRSALEARQASEQERRAALEAQAHALEQGRSELQAQHAAFDQSLSRQRADRLSAADAEAAAIVARAREAATREQERSQRMLSHLEQGQVERLASAVALATRQSVARLLQTIGGAELDGALVQAACRQFDGRGGSPARILVESARPLDDATRETLAKASGSVKERIDFRVVPELLAGVRVTTGDGVIDASAAGLAAHAERVVTEALASDHTDTEHT